MSHTIYLRLDWIGCLYFAAAEGSINYYLRDQTNGWVQAYGMRDPFSACLTYRRYGDDDPSSGKQGVLTLNARAVHCR